MIPRVVLLSLCLFGSGAAGLMYEVLWSRQFGLVMGQTVYALSTIITAFLGGLALGAWIGGRWTRRRGVSLRLYAAMEIGIGLTALCVPLLVHLLDPIFGVAYRTVGDSLVVYSLVQFVMCAAVVLVPTMLMGATLPVTMALLIDDRGDVTEGVGVLYAMNTLGGMVGAAVAGFLLLPQIGMAATSMVAVALNVAVGLIAFAVAAIGAGETVAAGATTAPTSGAVTAASEAGERRLPLIVFLYGVSGFAALCLEVAWARLVGLSIGSTTYGFSIILVGFIAGIGFGSLISPRLSFLRRDPLRGIFLLHAVIALAGVFSVAYLGQLPLVVLNLTTNPEIGVGQLILLELLVVFLTIALPTLAMGGIFPLLTTLLHRQLGAAGYATGLAYAANTLGNILGSLIAGFVLVPLIGMRATIITAALLSALAGAGYLLPRLRQGSTVAVASAATLLAAVAVGALIVPAWQPKLLISAPFLATPGARRASSEEGSDRIKEIVSFREGASTLVTVTKTATGTLMLFQDGVGESNTFGALHRVLGHMPLLLHGDAERVLVIGLGAGHTLSAVTTHPLEAIECIEISPEVVDAARQYFVRDGLDDPRVRLRVGDGRNHLRHSGELYDVIISQPSHVWQAGASSLFTRDFFSEVRAHLAPGGVASSWFFAYTEEARQSIVGAFAAAFPNSFLFNNGSAPSLLIGLRDDGPLSAAKLMKAMAAPRVAADLKSLGLDDPAKVMRTFIAAAPRLQEYAAGVPLNTDDNAYVAFHALGEAVPAPFTKLRALQQDPLPYIDATLDSPQQTDAFVARLRAGAGGNRTD